MTSVMISLLKNIAILYPALIIVFTFGGFFRALVAKCMGDNTAYSQGFLSLNPLAHVDILGFSIMMLFLFVLGSLLGEVVHPHYFYVLLAILGVRWVYVVPCEPRNFRRVKLGMIATILARPFGYFLLTLIGLYLVAYFPFALVPLGVGRTMVELFVTILNSATYFGVLAFLPIPPYPGGQLLDFLLPYQKRHIMNWLESYGTFVVLGLFVLPGIREVFFGTIHFLSLIIITLLSKLVF